MQKLQLARDKNRRTVRDVWGLQLTQVPGVSGETAEAVLAVYPTAKSLLAAYEAVRGDRRRGEALLQGVKMLRSSRTIGPSLSKAIYCNLIG